VPEADHRGELDGDIILESFGRVENAAPIKKLAFFSFLTARAIL
jgi:hypothetical protein